MRKADSVRVTVSMPRDLLARVEHYWHSRRLGSFSEAMRMLAENALPSDPSRYFAPGEFLVNRGPDRQLSVPGVPLLYIRIIPKNLGPNLRRADAVDLIRQGPKHLEPLYYRPLGVSFEPNEYGAIAFARHHDEPQVVAAAQLFLNREIWAFNATLFDPDASSRRPGIPTLAVELSLAVALPKYLQFAQEKLHLEPPFNVEAGSAGLKDYVIHMPPSYPERELGPIQQSNVVWRGALEATDPASVDSVLLQIFEEFFDAAGEHRPPALYGFPGATPGSLPRG